MSSKISTAAITGACVVPAATAVARFLLPTSIYMQELAERGIRWEMTLEGRAIERRTHPR